MKNMSSSMRRMTTHIYHGKSNSCSKPPTRKYDLDNLGVNFWETTGYSDVYPQMFQAEMRWKDGTKISAFQLRTTVVFSAFRQ